MRLEAQQFKARSSSQSKPRNSDLEQTHVEVELENGEDWNVEIDVHGHPATPHVLALLDGVDLLPTDHREDEEHVGGQRHDLPGKFR